MVEQAQLCAQPREQLIQTERLRDIVVGAATEAADDIRFIIPAVQHEDGHFKALPSQLCAEVAPIAVGQVYFEDQGVETPAFDGDDRLGLVQPRGREDGEPMLVPEAIRQRLPYPASLSTIRRIDWSAWCSPQ